jgi:NADPH:quinone reductase-like Zn-dependent oxidoreductase
MGMTHFQPQGAEIFQVYGNGGFAEYMKIPGNNVRHLPDDLPFEQAAKLAFLGVSLKGVERTRLKPGETIVISGASGAFIYNGVLYVSDRNNNRVLLFPQ